jgi:hypothetical protein
MSAGPPLSRIGSFADDLMTSEPRQRDDVVARVDQAFDQRRKLRERDAFLVSIGVAVIDALDAFDRMSD